MPNKYFNNMNGANIKGSGGAPTGYKGSEPGMIEKTANWPGTPGKSGPDRSNGVKKCKCYPKSEGI